jgi:hypothetical protein
MRILVAVEDAYRAYGDAIVRVIRSAYPHLEVMAVADQGDLQAQLARSDPHLLISIGQAVPLASRQGRLSWIELSVDPNKPSLIYLDGKRREPLNPSLGELLDVVEHTELILARAVDSDT